MEKDKAKCQELFLKHFNMNEEDLKILSSWFLEYGMNKYQTDPKPHKNYANHRFLQEICEEFIVSWETWGEKLSPELKDLVKTGYPQLMTTNMDFEW